MVRLVRDGLDQLQSWEIRLELAGQRSQHSRHFKSLFITIALREKYAKFALRRAITNPNIYLHGGGAAIAASIASFLI